MSQPTSFQAVRVSGADAAAFLNGQFTSNVLNLVQNSGDGNGHNRPLLGAFCTPKGRALAVAALFAADEAIELWTTASRIEALVAHLSRYVMRAKVRFEPFECTDARELPLPGGPFSLTEPDVAQRAVRAGLPVIDTGAEDAFVPQMINLDLLEGIDFSKGCYTGQEIVARTHHLGTIKRRMLALGCDDTSGIAPGDDVRTSAGDAAGRVVVVGQEHVLASLRLTKVGEALSVNDRGLGDALELPYPIPELSPERETPD